MNELIKKAASLLEANEVQVVIGYGLGSAKRPQAIL